MTLTWSHIEMDEALLVQDTKRLQNVSEDLEHVFAGEREALQVAVHELEHEQDLASLVEGLFEPDEAVELFFVENRVEFPAHADFVAEVSLAWS